MSDISVVIPTLNEEQHISALLEQLEQCPKVMEVLVVDALSTDNTPTIVSGYSKAKLISSERGRSIQMNNGAKEASGDILLFLHADSILNIEAIRSVAPTLEKVEAGCFFLMFDRKGFWLDVYSWFSRYNWTIFTYGDQGLFIKKDFFDRIGGFNNIPIMEDLDIVRRIKRHGGFHKVNHPIITGARRFKKNGAVLQQARNILIVSLFYAGVSPKWLARLYRY